MIEKMLKPFKIVSIGFYRLFLVLWLIVIIIFGFIEYSTNERYEGFFIAALIYYIVMRIALWVYNGFKKDKQEPDKNKHK